MTAAGRTRASRVLIVLGIVALVWAALYMTSHALGGPSEHMGFAHRRPYNQVKSAVHASILGLFWRASLGGALIWLGARLAPRPEA